MWRRYAQVLGDLLVAQSMLIFQVYRGAATSAAAAPTRSRRRATRVSMSNHSSNPDGCPVFVLDERVIEIDGPPLTFMRT